MPGRPPSGLARKGRGADVLRAAGRHRVRSHASRFPLARATPKARSARGGGTGLAALGDRVGGQNLAEIPKIYQPRLDPDRSTRAQRIGASAASELAVERALDWLSSPPGRRRPLGRRDRALRRRDAGQGRRRLHGALSPRRDLLRRVRLLGGRYRPDGTGPLDLSGGRLHPDRRAIRRSRWVRGSIS